MSDVDENPIPRMAKPLSCRSRPFIKPVRQIRDLQNSANGRLGVSSHPVNGLTCCAKGSSARYVAAVAQKTLTYFPTFTRRLDVGRTSKPQQQTAIYTCPIFSPLPHCYEWVSKDEKRELIKRIAKTVHLRIHTLIQGAISWIVFWFPQRLTFFYFVLNTLGTPSQTVKLLTDVYYDVINCDHEYSIWHFWAVNVLYLREAMLLENQPIPVHFCFHFHFHYDISIKMCILHCFSLI